MYKVVSTPKADISFLKVIDFILFIWNAEIVEDFITLTENLETILSNNPYLGKPLENNIRETIIHKNTSVFYEVDEKNKIIKILLFKENRQNPESYLKLL